MCVLYVWKTPISHQNFIEYARLKNVRLCTNNPCNLGKPDIAVSTRYRILRNKHATTRSAELHSLYLMTM